MKNDPFAQFEMGMMYEMGGEKEAARQWYEKSAAQGNNEEKQKLNEL